MGDEADQFIKMIEETLGEDKVSEIYKMAIGNTNMLSSVSDPYTPYMTTASNTISKHGVDYYMAYAQPNLLTIQETINNDIIRGLSEDEVKKRVKSDMARQLANEIMASKVTFTAQDNYAENTKIVRAKTYVFTHDQLVKFVENMLR